MRLALLALIAGLLSLRWLDALPSPAWWLLLVPLALMCLPYRLYPLGLFLLGLCWACLSAQRALDDRLAPALDGRTLWLEGTVAGLPALREQALSFELVEADSRRVRLPKTLRLSWRDAPELRAGERWRLAVKLRRPRGLANPQGFDYEAWLTAQRIGALGSVKQGEKLVDGPGPDWREGLRQRLREADTFGRGGALAALVVGDGSGLSRSDWQALQASGTLHLLVISGQHVMLLGGLVYALLLGLVRLGLWPPGRPWLGPACLLAWLAAAGYGLLAGMEVPVQRALLMLALILLWRWRFRQLPAWDAWLLALLGVLLWEPLASLQAGFWLSFAAVGWLIWCFAGRLGSGSAWAVLWHAQLCLCLGLLPLLLALGLPQSLSAPLANLLAVPWVSLVSVPLALLGSLCLPLPGVGDGLLWLAGGSLELLFRALHGLALWLPPWHAPRVAPWAVLLALLGMAWLLAPVPWPLRWPALLLALPLLAAPASRVPVGQAEVWVLDVGQGLAVLVRTAGHDLLYDAGPAMPGFDSGERIVLPSLRQLGVRRLDLLLLSHADNDHAGGAGALLAELPVRRRVSGEPGELPAHWRMRPCAPRTWRWEGVSFVQWRWAQGQGNAASCVLRIEAGGESLLLTGDLDEQAEAAFVAAHPGLAVDWLLAPHHGSRTSSSWRLLKALRPSAILLSRGRYNPFGHPHPEVLARWRALGLPVYDSAERGALRLWLGRHGAVEGWREEGGFWREK